MRYVADYLGEVWEDVGMGAWLARGVLAVLAVGVTVSVAARREANRRRQQGVKVPR